MYNEASQELGSLSIRSTCQEAFAFGLSLKLAFYPYTSHTYSLLPQKARGQPAKELACFSPRTFLISVGVPFDPLSILVFSSHATGGEFMTPAISLTGLSCQTHTAFIITVRQRYAGLA